jgi:hypothetical protein
MLFRNGLIINCDALHHSFFISPRKIFSLTKKKFQKVITGRCRLTYVNIFVPWTTERGEAPKYSLCILIPKDDNETLDWITEAVKDALHEGVELWGGLIPEEVYSGCYGRV